MIDTSPQKIMTSVVIVDDHSLVRDGMRMLLAMARDFQVVGEAGTVAQARRVVLTTKPHIAVLDLGLPDGDGIGLAGELLRALPELRILIVSGDLTPDTITRALQVGAHGYVHKQHDADELIAALHALADGGRYVSKLIAEFYPKQPGKPEAPSVLRKLTERETQIVGLLCEGNSSKHVARKLDLSVATVRKHRENIMAKLEVHCVAELLAIALKNR